MARPEFSIPTDGRGQVPPNAKIWTGEVQSIGFDDSGTAATKITTPGRWFMFYATTTCHIVIGNATINAAHATAANRCYPIPDGDTAGWHGPIYVPDTFDTQGDGTGDLYVRVIRNAANGTLYIAQAFPNAQTAKVGATTTSSTTTSTTTT